MHKLSKSLPFVLLFFILLIGLTFIYFYRSSIKRAYYSYKNSSFKKEIELEDIRFISQVQFDDKSVANTGCEEVAILMVANLYQNIEDDNSIYKKEIQDMRDVQNNKYGKEISLYSNEMAEVAKEKYNLRSQITERFDVGSIIEFLEEGRPVIAPVIADVLNNPFYQNYSGYHTVVIVGYDNKNFFVHDPGTGAGKNFSYSFDLLKKAAESSKDKGKVLILAPMII